MSDDNEEDAGAIEGGGENDYDDGVEYEEVYVDEEGNPIEDDGEMGELVEDDQEDAGVLRQEGQPTSSGPYTGYSSYTGQATPVPSPVQGGNGTGYAGPTGTGVPYPTIKPNATGAAPPPVVTGAAAVVGQSLTTAVVVAFAAVMFL